jgi:nucleotide-binding universal stress UspA family protein
MKTLVVPTDFSAVSLNAVNYAADMACVIGTNLSLIHVCLIPMAFSEVPAPAYDINQLISNAEEKLEALKEKISARTGGRLIITTIVKQGNVVPEIDEYCATVNTYAVVMGSESAGGLERFLGGGKTISAVKQFNWPLIVVPPEVKFTAIQKIGLACDFRKVAETIPLNEIKDLVQEFNASLHVLHVTNETGEAYNEEKIRESGWLHAILGEMKPGYHFINSQDVEGSIAEFADKNKLDMLIIIPKKHGLFSSLFKHSHSIKLVLHSHIPVMAIHE